MLGALSEIKDDAEPYDKEKIDYWDWTGVDLKKEAQGIEPKHTDSIQYRAIDILKQGNYDFIYDDDYSGEIADIITIKKYDDKFSIELYHLKFAHEGKISRRVDNLYEVCGQAQKSIHWKFKKGKEFFDHLLRRKTKSRKGKQCSRIIRGTEALLKEYLSLAKYKLQCEFKIFIVQPSIRKSIVTTEQLTLLGVTETYLREKAQVELGVIGSPEES